MIVVCLTKQISYVLSGNSFHYKINDVRSQSKHERKQSCRIQHFKMWILLSKVILNNHKARNPVIFVVKEDYRYIRKNYNFFLNQRHRHTQNQNFQVSSKKSVKSFGCKCHYLVTYYLSSILKITQNSIINWCLSKLTKYILKQWFVTSILLLNFMFS